jgi:hypothetical protein
MLSERLQDRFVNIIVDAVKMVNSHVDNNDLAAGINYASIYAQSTEDFDKTSFELENNGTKALERSSGDYFLLNKPLIAPTGMITHCRVRIFDNEHSEKGYVDFEVKNFQKFKDKYLSKPYFSLLNSGVEMIELRDPKFPVRAYFPNGSF